MAALAADNLVTDPAGTYVDATAGGGGHSTEIAARLGPEGLLVAVDRDGEALAATRMALSGSGVRQHLIHARFADLADACAAYGIDRVHGVLFDLGVSSHQLDQASRGFSFRADGPLDMRMDPEEPGGAAGWLTAVDEAELRRVIKEYGEERGARRIARAIIARRERQGLKTTSDLRAAVLSTRPRMPNKTLARVFQGIRIRMNDELGQLDRGLEAGAGLLQPGGRLVVISYHSLEDRLVKHKLAEWIRGCICPPDAPVCVCGRKPLFRKLLRRPQRPDATELQVNPRARSAIMRAFEKL